MMNNPFREGDVVEYVGRAYIVEQIISRDDVQLKRLNESAIAPLQARVYFADLMCEANLPFFARPLLADLQAVNRKLEDQLSAARGALDGIEQWLNLMVPQAAVNLDIGLALAPIMAHIEKAKLTVDQKAGDESDPVEHQNRQRLQNRLLTMAGDWPAEFLKFDRAHPEIEYSADNVPGWVNSLTDAEVSAFLQELTDGDA